MIVATWTQYYIKMTGLALGLLLLCFYSACVANQCVIVPSTVQSYATQHWQLLLFTILVYSVGTMSPGPSSLTILATALSQGRRNALALSSGVVISDILWAIVVAAGLLAAVRHSQTLFSALKILIGCYLTFMACKSVYSGIKNKSVFERNDRQPLSLPRHFLKGSAITLANPQIAITWLTAFSISMNVDAGLTFFGIVIPICAAISVLIYVGYAMVFSTPTMFKAYSTMHRPFDLMLGALFAFAAIKLLSSLNHG